MTYRIRLIPLTSTHSEFFSAAEPSQQESQTDSCYFPCTPANAISCSRRTIFSLSRHPLLLTASSMRYLKGADFPAKNLSSGQVPSSGILRTRQYRGEPQMNGTAPRCKSCTPYGVICMVSKDYSSCPSNSKQDL